MASRVTIRPRLLALSLTVALVVSIAGGYGLSRLLGDDDEVDANLDQPGEYDMPTGTAPSNEGASFPDVEVLDLEGQPVRTASLTGMPMVVNIWYSACGPCERELPAFAEVSAEYEGQVRFVGINPMDTVEKLESFAAEKGVTYENYRDPDLLFAEAVRALGFPTTVFVAADGTIVEQTNVLDANGLRSRVEDLL